MLSNADKYRVRVFRKILRSIEDTGRCYNTEHGILWTGADRYYLYDVAKNGLTCDVDEEDVLSEDLTDGEILQLEIL